MRSLRYWGSLLAILAILLDATTRGAVALTPGGSVTSSVTPSNATPGTGEQILVSIYVDMSGASAPDDRLGAFSGALGWNPAVLAYHSNSGLLSGFTGAVNASGTATGSILFNGVNVSGATGNVLVFQVTFEVIGTGASILDLNYTSMSAALTYANLGPILTVTDGEVVATRPGYSIYLPRVNRKH